MLGLGYKDRVCLEGGDLKVGRSWELLYECGLLVITLCWV